jgi:hypothetical protein
MVPREFPNRQFKFGEEKLMGYETHKNMAPDPTLSF